MKIISLVGAIGSGKTYTASKLKQYYEMCGKKVVIYNESVDENIFLGTEHREAVQAFYLLKREEFLKNLFTCDILIEDASIYQDLYYVGKLDNPSTFENKYHKLIENFYNKHEHEIYIVTSENNLDQIKHRGRDFEQGITEGDLSSQINGLLNILNQYKKEYDLFNWSNFELPPIHVSDDDIALACNKYVVKSALYCNGTQVSSGCSVKLGNPNVCGRKLVHGTDSSEFRWSNACDSIHAEVALLTNTDVEYLYGDINLVISAHPCYQCAKFIVYWNDVNGDKINTVHYAGPKADKEVYDLFNTHNIDIIWYGEDGRNDY